MPKFRGVYKGARGTWYFKASTHKDPLTGKWSQVTRRGFATAAEAAAAREDLLREVEAQPKVTVSGLTVRQLVEQYLDECEATERLGAKSLFDYRHYLDDYIDPWIGSLLVRELTADVVASWQHKLATEGGKKTGRGLSPNTIRLARAPLNGALKQAGAMGVLPANPLASVPRPKPRRSIPKHWSPDEARQFLALHEGDRLWPTWAFLLGSGVRIGELVYLAWSNVDLEERLVRVNEFATVLGYDVQRSNGKSRDAVRTIDLDRHLVDVLRRQRKLQAEERLRAATYEASDYVFTEESGGPYHGRGGRVCHCLSLVSEVELHHRRSARRHRRAPLALTDSLRRSNLRRCSTAVDEVGNEFGCAASYVFLDCWFGVREDGSAGCRCGDVDGGQGHVDRVDLVKFCSADNLLGELVVGFLDGGDDFGWPVAGDEVLGPELHQKIRFERMARNPVEGVIDNPQREILRLRCLEGVVQRGRVATCSSGPQSADEVLLRREPVVKRSARRAERPSDRGNGCAVESRCGDLCCCCVEDRLLRVLRCGNHQAETTL